MDIRTMKFEQIETPKSGKNLGTSQGCARCRAKVNDRTAKFIHIIDGGGTALHPDDESKYVPDAGDVGGYPVGPECAKFFGEFAR